MKSKYYCKKCKEYFYGWGVGNACPKCGGTLEKVKEAMSNEIKRNKE